MPLWGVACGGGGGVSETLLTVGPRGQTSGEPLIVIIRKIVAHCYPIACTAYFSGLFRQLFIF